MKRQETLIKKVEGMFNKINIDQFIRKTLHLKKEKPSNYKLGKKGIEQIRGYNKRDLEMIETFS